MKHPKLDPQRTATLSLARVPFYANSNSETWLASLSKRKEKKKKKEEKGEGQKSRETTNTPVAAADPNVPP